MFKPLLKTLPSLSGNMKIACKLDGYKNVRQNIYECFVNEAKLAPLSHDLYDKNIKLNGIYPSAYGVELDVLAPEYIQKINGNDTTYYVKGGD